MEDQTQIIQKQGEQIKKLRKDVKYLIDENHNFTSFFKKEIETLFDFLKYEVNTLHDEIDGLAEDIDYIKTKSSSANRHLKSLAKGLKLPNEHFMSDTDNDLFRRRSRHSRGRKSKKPEVYGSLNDLPKSTINSPQDRQNLPYRLQQRSYSPLSSSDSGEDTAKQVDLSPNRIPNSPYTIVKDEINTPELTPVLQNKDLLVYQPASLDSLTNTYGRSEQTEYNQPNLTRNTLHPVQNTSTVINSTFATSTPVSTTYRPSYGTSNIPTQSTVNEVTKVTNVGGPSVNTNTKGTSNISTDDNIPFKETTMVTNVGGPSVNTNTKRTSNISTDDNIPFKETTMVTNVGGPSLNTNTNETDNIDGNLPTKVTPLTIHVNQKPNQQENIQTETQILVDFNNVEGYLKSCHIDITPETKQAIEEAFKGDDNQQKPKGIYTILLVDTSKSMDGEPGQQMKNYLVNFIDEVENSAANNNLEENVAVVTFGAKTSINHRFTNDFGAIRESFENLHFEGRSPLLTGLALCVKYLKETGEVLDITSVVRVKPRIILVTDGLVTNDSHFTGQDHEQNSIQCQTKVLNFLSSTKHLGYQIICVGMGEYNKSFLQSFSCTGGLSKTEDVLYLARYYFYKTVIGQVIAENDEIGGQGNVPALVNRATRDNDSTHLSQGDREEISRLLQEYNIDYEAQPESDEEELKDFGFYDKYARLLSIGTRVKRGPGWSWGNQDSNGPGTVVAHKDEGELMVKWDNGHINAYFYNHSETSHVVKYDSRRILGPGEDIEVGCCVKRGQDWNPNSEEDGGSGTVGIVIRKHHDKKVSVRWPSQVVEKYSFGHDNKYEIEVVNGHDEAQLDTGYIGGSQPMDIPGGEDIVYAWQWQDQSHQWRTLPQEAAAKLEDHYLSKKQGTTLVKHYSLQMRCDPVKLKYTINGQLGSLQRIMLSQTELNNLHSLEEMMIQDF